jgi:hypothetical protein
MIHLVNIIYLFALCFLVLYIGYPDPTADSDSWFANKFLLFFWFFAFQLLFGVFAQIHMSCKVEVEAISKRALQFALVAVIGYGLYTDLGLMTSTREWIQGYQSTYAWACLAVSVCIAAAITGYQAIAFLIKNPVETVCETIA